MRATYTSRKLLLITGLALVVLGSIITSIARGDINSGVTYLKSQGDNPWVTMSLVAAGEPVNVDYLKDTTGTDAIQFEAPILAITAAGEDPRIFPDENLVAKLKSFYDGNQIGDASSLNDDIFGILALIASGESQGDVVIEGAKNFLIGNQSDDGGWAWAVDGASSVDMTAMAIMALTGAGASSSDNVIQNGIEYLRSAQNDDGGFPSESGGDSNASSTAWAISAINELGESLSAWAKEGTTPADFLWSLQADSGYFENTAGAGETGFSSIETAYAVIALSGKSYPVNIITPTPTPLVSYRIEGSGEVLCTGEIEIPNPLQLIKDIADICGFDYEIEQLSFGPYLKRIGNDEAEGFTGWLYLVNFISPPVGAADYNLEEGDEILWFYGDFDWSPTRVSLSKENFSSDEEVVITVESFEDGTWSILTDATVFVGALDYTTDQNGKVAVTLPDGAYRVFAEGVGYVRSEKILITVGDKAEAEIGLVAVVSAPSSGGGGGGGTSARAGAITFLLNTTSVDFGPVQPGGTYSDLVGITNEGQVGIYVESIVSGDDLFRNYVKVDSNHWRNFSTTLQQNEEKNVNVGLSIPGNYTSFGSKSGSIIFWAVQNQ